jgi:hypothetical protein
MLSPFCLVYYSFDDRDIILLFKNLLKCDEKGFPSQQNKKTKIKRMTKKGKKKLDKYKKRKEKKLLPQYLIA